MSTLYGRPMPTTHTQPPMEANIDVQVLKSSVCPSLSGKTTLNYEIGRGPAGEVLVRINKTSGTGYYSKDWIALERAYKLLQAAGKTPVTFGTLLPLFAGKSINTAGFLLAALKKEGLVKDSEEVARCYQLADAKPFFDQVKALMTAGKGTTKAVAKTAMPATPRKVSGKARAPKK